MHNAREFDLNNDGLISTDQLTKILKHRLSRKDLDDLTKEADPSGAGLVDYKGKFTIQQITMIRAIIHSILQNPYE